MFKLTSPGYFTLTEIYNIIQIHVNVYIILIFGLLTVDKNYTKDSLFIRFAKVFSYVFIIINLFMTKIFEMLLW